MALGCLGVTEIGARTLPDRASKEPLRAIGAHVWPLSGLPEYSTAQWRSWEVLAGFIGLEKHRKGS